MCRTEIYLREQNHSLRTLVALCRGLQDSNGNHLFDLREDPWTTLPSSLVKPNTAEYSKEIERRWQEEMETSKASASKAPRPKAWKLDKLLEWLDKHPITAKADIEYLQKMVSEKKNEVKQADLERKSSGSKNGEQRGNWIGKIPHLRIIHCLVDDDDVKRAYLHRNDIPQGRLHIDNRNSVDKRNKTVWELMADKFNDPSFNPVSEQLPHLHSDFICSEDIGHDSVKEISRATPEKCQSKLAAMILQMNRCIAKWERSGQGEGGHVDSTSTSTESSGDEVMADEQDQDSFFTGVDDETGAETKVTHYYGTLNDRSKVALDSRHCFFPYHQSYLLYLWEMLSKHDLLRSSLQKLDDIVASSDGAKGVPSVVVHARPPPNQSDVASVLESKDEMGDLASLSNSIHTLAKNAITVAEMQIAEEKNNRIHETIRQLRDSVERVKSEKRKLCTQLVTESTNGKKNKAMIDLLEKQIQELGEDQAKQEAEMNNLLHG